MKVISLQVGQLQTNCYLAWDENSFEAVIIDTGDDADFISRKIQDFNLKPRFILATHGHFDHVLAITELRLAYKIPFMMHQSDLFLLKRAGETAKYFTSIGVDPLLPPDKFLTPDIVINFGEESLKVIETPGHTPGGVSFYSPGVLFSGDTLFYQGVGRTDFSYGSPSKLEKSVKKLLCLPGDTIVYPGHSSVTTIEEEKEKVF